MVGFKVHFMEVRGWMRACGLAILLVVPSVGVNAQQQPQDQKKPPLKTTETVVVHGDTRNLYESTTTSFGGFSDISIQQLPSSVTVIPRSILDDQQSRLLSDVVKNDASIGEDYAPVGWYQDFAIRGFTIDTASALKINGLTIAGEQLVPLENKESVEILKGLVGLENGVAAPGGIINYVTKRPADIASLTIATDHRGTSYLAFDFGGLFGARKQFGWRANGAGERLMSYVNDADGWRAMGAFDGDWKIDSSTVLKGNVEYQHLVQRSVGGYQLLGGTVVPQHYFPSNMLGEQSWAKPNTYDDVNVGIRVDHSFSSNWKAYIALGRSHTLLDDNIAWSYGAAYQADGETQIAGCENSPYYFFCPDGSYAIYDYRSPGELRINDQLLGILNGHVRTGAVTQEVTVGASLQRRSVALPSSVYDFVGNGNIYQQVPQYERDSDVASPAELVLDDHQAALVLSDRIHLPFRVDATVGGQLDRLRDHNYANTCYDATDDYYDLSCKKYTERTNWLPQYALLYRPLSTLSLYGSYSEALSLGIQAPFWVTNASAFLDSYLSRQVEVGAKYEASSRLLMTLAFFKIHSPFFYPKPDASAEGLTFVSEGHENHRGVEFGAQGRATNWLQLTASFAALQSLSEDTGTTAYDNKQIIDIPHVRATIAANVAVPHVKGLYLLPGWSYSGAKAATRDDAVSVPGYNLFNLGAKYMPGGEQGRVVFRLYADNIGDKRYWKDTGANDGDTFLHPGAPTTVRLSAQYRF